MIISPIEFVSQKKHGKRSEYSCGVACLMMLLKYNNTSYHTTFKKLGDFLEVDKRAIDKSGLELRVMKKDDEVNGKFKLVDILPDKVVVYSIKEQMRRTFPIGGGKE